MLYRLARPLLFKLDAERAHHLGLSIAQTIASSPRLAAFIHDRLARPKDDPVTVAGLTFPNRIGLAAGMDKNALAPLAWYAFGFGHMELGTLTPLPQPGNDPPRLFRFPEHAALVNRMGFNNDGAAAAAQQLAYQKRLGTRPPCPIGISIGKNKLTPPEKAADDYAKCATLLAPHADYLAINISSPNTPGLRDLQTADEVAKLLRAVKIAAPTTTFVKLAPELSGDTLADILSTCADHGAAGIIATNTLSTANISLLPNSALSTQHSALPQGGLSGAPLHDLSLRQVDLIRKFLPPALALIACGGISTPAHCRSMLNAGASLLQLYSALIYQGPLLPARLTRA